MGSSAKVPRRPGKPRILRGLGEPKRFVKFIVVCIYCCFRMIYIIHECSRNPMEVLPKMRAVGSRLWTHLRLRGRGRLGV